MKNFLILLFLTLSIGLSAQQQTDTQLTTLSNQVKNETTAGANTANRIGLLFNYLNDSKLSDIDFAIASGTNSYTATIPAKITSLATGYLIRVQFTNANTASSTIVLTPSGGSAFSSVLLTSNGSSAITSGTISAGQAFLLHYNGTAFQLLGGAGASGLTSGTTTISGGTSTRVLYDNAGVLGEYPLNSANGIVGRDANSNTSINNINEAFVTQAAISGTTTLTISSAPNQQFTGSTSGQIVKLPDATTLVTGFQFSIYNRTTQTLAIQDGAAGALQTMSAGSQATFTCASIGTSAGSWDIAYTIGAGTALPVANGGTGVTTSTGSGNTVLSTSPTLVTPVLGTPTSVTLTNGTGLPISTGVSGLGTGVATFLATPSSANLSGALTDETGSGAAVFGTTPTIATPVINGLPTGTGVASAATASTLAARDANANLSANNYQPGYTTTATAAGTTTLTVSSTQYQYFTGTTTQTVTMPVVSTLSTNPQTTYTIVNNSTGVVTVQSSGSNTIQLMQPGSVLIISCISTSGTGTTSWNASYFPQNPMTAIGDIIVGSTVVNGIATPARIASGTANYILTSTGVGSTPAWTYGIIGTTTNDNAAAGVVGEIFSSAIAVGSATSLTTATAKNITSISLTAGQWEVSGCVSFTEGSATVTARSASIGTTTATINTDGTEANLDSNTTTLTQKITILCTPQTIKLSGTTTVYLVGKATFSAGTNSGYGYIKATRVR